MSTPHRFTTLPLEAPPPPTVLRRDIVAAVLTGQLAGLIMAVSMMVAFPLSLGKAWYLPLQVIGSFVLGEPAVSGGFVPAAFLMGLFIHQAIVSFAWSLVFGFVMSRMEATWANAVAVGASIALAGQVVFAQIVVPTAMTLIHGVDLWNREMPLPMSWVAHVLFGASFALFMPVWKALAAVNQVR